MNLCWLCMLMLLFAGASEQRGGLVDVAIDIGKGIAKIIRGLKQGNKIKSDFTKNFVNQARQKYPGYFVVIAHNARTSGQAIHQHVEVPLAIGGTYGYDIFFVKPGQRFDLWLKGDAGYINWAYAENFKRNGKHLSMV